MSGGGHGGRCNNPGVLWGKGRINAGFPRIVAFLCNNPGENGCFSGIIVVLRWPVRPAMTLGWAGRAEGSRKFNELPIFIN